MADLVETQEPVIMDVSAYSMMAQKLSFLAQTIQNESEADSKKVFIECFTTEKKGKPFKVIRLSTDLHIWTELSPYDKEDGDILPQNIAVNLYDLYTAVDNCKDDIINFWIDEEDNELVVSSFYNENRGYSEFEVRLNILDKGFPSRDLDLLLKPEAPQLFSFELDAMSLRDCLDLNREKRTDGINIVIRDRHMSIQSEYHGLKTNMILKVYKEIVFFKDGSVFLPFYILNLIAGSGETLNPVKFDVYDEHVVINTSDYKYSYVIENSYEPFFLHDDGYKDYFVVDSTNMERVCRLITSANKPSPLSTMRVEKLDKAGAEFSVEYEGRYTIVARVDLAMLSDDIVFLDTKMMTSIFTNTGVDAIKVKYNPDIKSVYISYEGQFTEYEIVYDHEEFEAYRKEMLS